MPVPARFSRLAWLIGSIVACLALTGFPLFLCPGVHASDNVSLATAMEKYYKGDISGALKNIRAHLGETLRTWKRRYGRASFAWSWREG